MIKKYILTLFLLCFFKVSFATERDSIIELSDQFYQDSAVQLDFLYNRNKTENQNKWYIFFLGSNLEELEYIIQESQYNDKYDQTKLTALNNKLRDLNSKNPTHEVYAALTDYEKTLKVVSLFKGKTINEHVEEIQSQRSVTDGTGDSPERTELVLAESAMKNFNAVKTDILDKIYDRTTAFKTSTKSNHFLAYVMNITYETIANYEGDALKKQFFTWGMHPKKKNGAIDKARLTELYKRFKTEPDKSNLYRFAEVRLESVVNALENYILLPSVEGLETGIGQEIYQLYADQFTTGSQEDKKLIELANFLTENYKDEKFVVDIGCIEYNCEVIDDLITAISEKNIKTKEEFDEVFPYRNYARNYIDGKNDFTFYYSSIDLWENLDLNTYNLNSFDYLIEDNGVEDKYHYSLNDLFARHKAFNDPDYRNIKTIILDTEELGQASSVSQTEFYDQYYHKYDTDSAFYFIAEWSARFAQEPLAAFMVHRLVVTHGAFLVQQLIVHLGEGLAAQIIREKGKDMMLGAIIDYGMQATMNYYFDPRFENNFKDASNPANINLISVAASAGESALDIQNKYAAYGISALNGCFVNGWTDANGFRDDFNVGECGKGVAAAFIANRVAKYLKILAKYSKTQITKGLKKMGFDDVEIEKIIDDVDQSADELMTGSNKLDDILNGKEFDELFEKLKNLNSTPNRAIRYANKAAFKDAFEDLFENVDKTAIKSYDDVIEDLDNLLKNTQKLEGENNLRDFVDEMMQSANKFKAAATSLEVITNPNKYFNQGVELIGLEDAISAIKNSGRFRFDIKFKTNSGEVIEILVDTKNYKNISGVFSDSGMKQFKAYLAKVKSFDELKIIQQNRPPNVTIDKMKNAFINAIKNDAKGVFDANQNLFKSLKNVENKTFIEDWEDFASFIGTEKFNSQVTDLILQVTK
ncbi:hypothetical protein HZY62_06950 [Maribacter polysiphoniae]|uniref:Uncharacterized protein n=1 Tax=Maribacter polysiphoniae TaxID=429344 RepID=A0A316ERQ4_9FLAO|nr:hypothetical protein [Maribacter polysiphoniae]MBD1260318.1 hypothetical protein [Maribacter polysiphoniae]PWK25780.1 hypothetical protein LX92_00523 [Maribacter polysiphoniae]